MARRWRTRAGNIIIYEYYKFIDTYPVFLGEPWWAWRFPTHASPKQQRSGITPKPSWAVPYLGTSIPKNLSNMHAHCSSQCSRELKLQCSHVVNNNLQKRGYTQHYLHRNIAECQRRRPHKRCELRCSGCDERSGRQDGRMHAWCLCLEAEG